MISVSTSQYQSARTLRRFFLLFWRSNEPLQPGGCVPARRSWLLASSIYRTWERNKPARSDYRYCKRLTVDTHHLTSNCTCSITYAPISRQIPSPLSACASLALPLLLPLSAPHLLCQPTLISLLHQLVLLRFLLLQVAAIRLPFLNHARLRVRLCPTVKLRARLPHLTNPMILLEAPASSSLKLLPCTRSGQAQSITARATA